MLFTLANICRNPYVAAETYRTGKTSKSAVVGYFTNDTELDVIVSNVDDRTISILPGNGDGSFRATLEYFTGKGPFSVT